jgi:hypothetical protein
MKSIELALITVQSRLRAFISSSTTCGWNTSCSSDRLSWTKKSFLPWSRPKIVRSWMRLPPNSRIQICNRRAAPNCSMPSLKWLTDTRWIHGSAIEILRQSPAGRLFARREPAGVSLVMVADKNPRVRTPTVFAPEVTELADGNAEARRMPGPWCDHSIGSYPRELAFGASVTNARAGIENCCARPALTRRSTRRNNSVDRGRGELCFGAFYESSFLHQIRQEAPPGVSGGASQRQDLRHQQSRAALQGAPRLTTLYADESRRSSLS